MKCNVGSVDRIMRLAAGLAILGTGYYFSSWWALVGVLPLLTAVFGLCPGYLPFQISTCKTKGEKGGKSCC